MPSVSCRSRQRIRLQTGGALQTRVHAAWQSTASAVQDVGAGDDLLWAGRQAQLAGAQAAACRQDQRLAAYSPGHVPRLPRGEPHAKHHGQLQSPVVGLPSLTNSTSSSASLPCTQQLRVRGCSPWQGQSHLIWVGLVTLSPSRQQRHSRAASAVCAVPQCVCLPGDGDGGRDHVGHALANAQPQ